MEIVLILIIVGLIIVGVISLIIFLSLTLGTNAGPYDERSMALLIFVVAAISLVALSIQRKVMYTKIAQGDIEVYALKGKDSTVVDYQIIIKNR